MLGSYLHAQEWRLIILKLFLEVNEIQIRESWEHYKQKIKFKNFAYKNRLGMKKIFLDSSHGWPVDPRQQGGRSSSCRRRRTLLEDVRWVTSPDGFRLVELLFGGLYLLDLFLLFLLLVVDLLNLGLLFSVFLFLSLLIFYFLQDDYRLPTYDAYTWHTFSSSLVTVSWKEYEMNSECFLTIKVLKLVFFGV
jgi:hypothetical protein